MERYAAIVVGGGISGASFAFSAASAGGRVLLVEKEARLGGCLHTVRLPSGYWFELGAHTCYNSYGGLLEIVEATGQRERILPRAKAPFWLLRDGKLLSVFSALDKWEAVRSIPRVFSTKRDGLTVRDYFSRLVGERNYDRVLGPFLAAVPSQRADGFPAAGPGSLFKKRPRRKDIVKHFTLREGLSSVVEGIRARPGVETLEGAEVRAIEREGSGLAVVTAAGQRLAAATVAVAVPPRAAARLLRGAFPDLAAVLEGIEEATVETVGAVVAKEKASLPRGAFIVPADDAFHSIVTRDVVPDDRFRAFSFHFKPGLSREQRLARMEDVLKVPRAEWEASAERTAALPSPALGHASTVAAIDRLLAGTPLALTGNYFAGLAIEDCIARSKQEHARVAALA